MDATTESCFIPHSLSFSEFLSHNSIPSTIEINPEHPDICAFSNFASQNGITIKTSNLVELQGIYWSITIHERSVVIDGLFAL
jgi:hypothetical protein